MAGSNIDIFEDNNTRKENQPAILDMVTMEILRFQTIPPELSVEMDSGFSEVKTSGRNNPIYHYTGSSNQIKLTLSWYSNYHNRQDVIRKCKWLEALTKADGYVSKPHEIRLIWGELFKQSKFIVTSAPYKLGLFIRNQGMLPSHATQEITLNRITTTNLSYSDIQKYNY